MNYRATIQTTDALRATDGLESFALGDLPGISMVLVDGEPLVTGRSEQTPPTRRPARITHGAS
jgi:enamidase